MKKQVVFIRDLNSASIIQIADVVDVTSDKFESLSENARKVSNELINYRKEEQMKVIHDINDSIMKLKKEIDQIKEVLTVLLGEEYEIFIKKGESEEPVNEEEH